MVGNNFILILGLYNSRIRDFSMNLDFDDESWRYILLPVYLATYTYNNQAFQVMINGQTGTISSQRPVDWFKVWLAVAGLLGPGFTLGVIGLVTLLFREIGLVIAIAGFVLLVIGLVIAFNLVEVPCPRRRTPGYKPCRGDFSRAS